MLFIHSNAATFSPSGYWLVCFIYIVLLFSLLELISINHAIHSFKCHQAAEKSLKAAMFAIDCTRTTSHDLATIAANINNPHVSRFCS